LPTIVAALALAASPSSFDRRIGKHSLGVEIVAFRIKDGEIFGVGVQSCGFFIIALGETTEIWLRGEKTKQREIVEVSKKVRV
jgi:hypothetical protein